MTAPNTVTVDAPAKVNLFLRVLGRRPDGYHDLESLVMPVSLADRLRVHAHNDPSRFRTLSLSLGIVGEPRLVRSVPPDESNLVIRAAAALAERAGVRGFAEFELEKRIPSPAGLGGGSSDAAAALRALNDLWGCGLDGTSLAEVAAAVGSDVPALLAARPVLVGGRGEDVEYRQAGPFDMALVTFDFGVRTVDAYRWWDEDGGGTGPDPAPVLDAAARGDLEAVAGLVRNDLEAPVARRHPQIAAAEERLLAAGAMACVMCGSGPTVAGLLRPGSDLDLPGAIRVRTIG